jgi:hypothetical protein
MEIAGVEGLASAFGEGPAATVRVIACSRARSVRRRAASGKLIAPAAGRQSHAGDRYPEGVRRHRMPRLVAGRALKVERGLSRVPHNPNR